MASWISSELVFDPFASEVHQAPGGDVEVTDHPTVRLGPLLAALERDRAPDRGNEFARSEHDPDAVVGLDRDDPVRPQTSPGHVRRCLVRRCRVHRQRSTRLKALDLTWRERPTAAIPLGPLIHDDKDARAHPVRAIGRTT